jgi:hypothetical protein
VPEVLLPKDCRKGAFVHIGYAEQASPKDPYGHLGPLIAAERLEKTVADLRAQGVTCVMAYSEGVHDDVNKAILAGLSSGQFPTADAVLQAYARRYFGVDQDTAKHWARWLRAWGKPFDVPLESSRRDLEALLKKTPEENWRRRQWELKQELFEVNHEIQAGKAWTPQRLAAVERFWAVQEKIQRGVWGLGPQRAVFCRPSTPLPWYGSWAKYKGEHAQALGENQ